MKSPSIFPLKMAMAGKNIMAIEAVANSIELASLDVDTAAEYHRECPALSKSVYPSITTTESSTIIPSTAISAARVTVFSSNPRKYMMPSVAAMQIGTDVELTSAVRSGKSSNMTTITTRMASIRSRRNDRTERSTTCGWSVMRWIWMSGVSVFSYSANTFSTFLPNSTTLFPLLISSESTIQRVLSVTESLYRICGTLSG